VGQAQRAHQGSLELKGGGPAALGPPYAWFDIAWINIA